MLNSKFWLNYFRIFGKNKLRIRRAKIEDIPQILKIEKVAWGDEKAAIRDMFESRIKTFPEGTLIITFNREMVGVISTEIINYNENVQNWYEITDNGFITGTHNPAGDILYGVDLSVHPLYQNRGVGKKLMECIGKLIIKYNLKQGMLGSRILEYHKYAGKVSVEDYVFSKDLSIPCDPELYFYKKLGLKIVKIIPEYFKDFESLNYGVLMVWRNPFYNKWWHGIAAKFFRV